MLRYHASRCRASPRIRTAKKKQVKVCNVITKHGMNLQSTPYPDLLHIPSTHPNPTQPPSIPFAPAARLRSSG
ncbi:hypothetical protein BCR44DRAFT_340854 [Catenaria anguillulae PL171]|uniref:Uncharacterized protein n=1 Tax=Catenaria anguillulae PL171 TaxID=765915 RepID=A0A1Y2HX57_9FUNG|nr:hypothetical protein BCR44DRAFT_340854 [Catenaria anguillulae PL171]